MVRWRLFGLLAAVLGLTAPDGARAGCQMGRLAEFPITMHGTAPWTTVEINGQPTAFTLDSGAFYSTITPAKAAELKLHLEPAPWNLRVIGIGGEAASVDVTTVNTLTLSGVPIPRIQFLVVGQGGGGSAGLLGQNILHIADVDYDLAHGSVKLMQVRDCDRTVLAYWAKDTPYNQITLIRGSQDNDHHTYGYVLVNGVRLKATFDTGASASIINTRAAARAGLRPEMDGAKPIGGSHGIGSHVVRTWIVPVASFKVGDEEIKNTRMQIGELELNDSDMLLGADFFLAHHVYVSNSQRQIYFTYNGGNVFNLTAPSSVERPMGTGGVPPVSSSAQTASAAPADTATTNPDEPKDAEDFSRRGAALAARLDDPGAIRDFTKAIELAPNESRYYYQRAQAHSALKQPFLAMADLDEALKRQPDNADALLARAEFRLGGKDRSGAAQDLDKASAALPGTADARLRLAQDDERLDRFEQVVTELDRWIPAHEDEAQSGSAFNLRCLARANLGRELDRALDDCNRSIRIARNAANLENRGLVHLRRAEYDRAIDDYNAALTIRGNLAWALYGRGLARLYKGDNAAAADIAAAKALTPKIAQIATARGIVGPPQPAPATTPAPVPPAAGADQPRSD